jgi:site-specific DNA recombinase
VPIAAKVYGMCKGRKGYVCGNYYKHGKKACTQHNVKEKELITAILGDVRSLSDTLNEKEFIGRLEGKAVQARKQSEKQALMLQKQIDKLREEKKGLIKLVASETITKADYLEVTKSNNEELSCLQDKLKSLSTLQRGTDSAETILKLKQELKKFMKLKELTPDMLHRLINRIEVKADGSVNFCYKFAATAMI